MICLPNKTSNNTSRVHVKNSLMITILQTKIFSCIKIKKDWNQVCLPQGQAQMEVSTKILVGW